MPGAPASLHKGLESIQPVVVLSILASERLKEEIRRHRCEALGINTVDFGDLALKTKCQGTVHELLSYRLADV